MMRDINQCAQNRPSLIVRDLEALGIAPRDSAHILMQRGVCKWLAVRRDLIRLKDEWRKEISRINIRLRELRKCSRLSDARGFSVGYARRRNRKIIRLRGYLHALEHCRAAISRLCHSPRYRVPDNDIGFWRYLIGIK